MSEDNFDRLTVARRVFAPPVDESREGTPDRRGRKSKKRREPYRTIVFDTETTTDQSQRFVFGVWRHYIDSWNSAPGRYCVTEGIVYADDLPERDPQVSPFSSATVETYLADVAPGRDTRLKFLSRAESRTRLVARSP